MFRYNIMILCYFNVLSYRRRGANIFRYPMNGYGLSLRSPATQTATITPATENVMHHSTIPMMVPSRKVITSAMRDVIRRTAHMPVRYDAEERGNP